MPPVRHWTDSRWRACVFFGSQARRMRYFFAVPSLELKPFLIRDFRPDVPHLIAVSGGRDSVALLNGLISLGYDRLIVCHLNHRLRAHSSDADARFVKRLVEGYNQDVAGQALRLPSARTCNRSGRPTMISRLRFELGSANIRALG